MTVATENKHKISCVGVCAYTDIWWVTRLTVSKMHAMHFNNSLNMEISGVVKVCFRTKHLPKDSGDLNTEKRDRA